MVSVGATKLGNGMRAESVQIPPARAPLTAEGRVKISQTLQGRAKRQLAQGLQRVGRGSGIPVAQVPDGISLGASRTWLADCWIQWVGCARGWSSGEGIHHPGEGLEEVEWQTVWAGKTV